MQDLSEIKTLDGSKVSEIQILQIQNIITPWRELKRTFAPMMK